VILVDTSVWIDHLRKQETELERLLELEAVLCHPLVIGEIALGNLRNRDAVLAALRGLPAAKVAPDPAVLSFIAANALAGTGLGYVDAHLLVSVRLTPGASLWTRDRRLKHVASRLDLLYPG
jgi:predicted nucleic acid-binding protein